MCLPPLMPSPLTQSTWQVIFNSSHVSPLPEILGTPSHRAVDTILQMELGLWALAHHTLVIP